MRAKESGQVIYVSTFPPRRCGLATFTADLVEAVDGASLLTPGTVIAMTQAPGDHVYGPQALLELIQDRREDYRAAARWINSSGPAVVNLQHEFGIFGGLDGEYVLDFLDALDRPLITTLHTVLSQPDRHKLELIREIGRHSQVVVVMARRAIDLLTQVYGLPTDRITLIPHGAPTVSVAPRRNIRRRLGLEGRTILCTLGLINPGKGIEYALEALPRVVGTHPDTLYMVLGQTHPGVRRLMGEAYRDMLLEMVRDLGLQNHVKFVDDYLSQQALIDYLVATDLYVTPYLGREQIASGTLAYAMGLGKAVISTPYFYAEELLGEGRGLLVDFRDPEGLAEAILMVLGSPELRATLESRAGAFGREMSWPRVGMQYARLFLESMGPDSDQLARLAPLSPEEDLHEGRRLRQDWAGAPGGGF